MPACAQELALDRFADIRVAGSGGRTVTVVAETRGELAEDAGRYQKHALGDEMHERSGHVDRKRAIGESLLQPGHEAMRPIGCLRPC
jgi:hypothetical protein